MSATDSTPAPPSHTAHRWREATPWLALAACVMLGAILRLRLWGGPTSDEVAVVRPLAEWGLDGFLANPEWSRNSPLMPLAFALIDRPMTALLAGRALAVACSMAAPLAVFAALRRATLDDFAAWAGAAFVALDAMLAGEGCTFRCYAVYALVEATRLWCLCRDADARRGRPSLAFVAFTALLPWIHYAAFPTLALEAVLLAIALPRQRSLLRAHAFAAIASAPLIALILRRGVGLVSKQDGLDRAVFVLLGGVLSTRAAPVALLIALSMVGLYASRASVRALAAHGWAVAGCVGVLITLEQVRPSAAVLGVVPTGIAVGLIAAAVGRGSIWRCVVTLVVAMALRSQFDGELRPRLIPASESTAIAVFARERATERGGGTWHVFPPWNSTVLAFDLEAEGVATTRTSRGFRANEQSFEQAEELEAPPPGRLVVLSCVQRPTGCRVMGGPTCAQVYECPDPTP